MVLLTACTGAAPTELFDPVTRDTGGASPIGGDDDPRDAGARARADGGAPASGAEDPAGGDEGRAPDASAPPSPPACAAEIEPNDDAEDATPFTRCVRGTVRGRDVDFVEITAPADATGIEIAHSETGGKVAYRVYINGMPFPSFSGDAPDFIPAVTSATYRFEIERSGGGGATRAYELEVTFD